MQYPNLLICGAQKAGTTALHELLAEHPEIFMSLRKEPQYFIKSDPSHFFLANTIQPENLGLGMTTERYQKLFPHRDHVKYYGESSTQYLSDPSAASEIARLIPQCKIIIVIRDPIARAYSSFNYNVSTGDERESRFKDVVEKEIRGERDQYWYGMRYLFGSRYELHIARFRKTFSDENCLLVSFQNFTHAPQATLRSIKKFLNLSIDFNPPNSATNTTNITYTSRSGVANSMHNLIYRPSSLKAVAKKIIPDFLMAKMRYGLIRRLSQAGGVRPEPLPKEIREILELEFKATYKYLQGLNLPEGEGDI